MPSDISHEEALETVKGILNFIKENPRSTQWCQIRLVAEDINYELYEKILIPKCKNFYFSCPEKTHFILL
jgi:hypothetical protein